MKRIILVNNHCPPTAGASSSGKLIRGGKPGAGWVNESDFEKEPIK